MITDAETRGRHVTLTPATGQDHGQAVVASAGSPPEIALTHHERWDPSGYPAGLAGDRIPLAGRAVAVADVFDALTHVRPYKQAWPVEPALAEVDRVSGTQLDPAVVQALAAVGGETLLAPIDAGATTAAEIDGLTAGS